MNEQLKEEALELCSQLSMAYYREESRHDVYGIPTWTAESLIRLRKVWRKAADRWRRRAGYDTIYE